MHLLAGATGRIAGRSRRPAMRRAFRRPPDGVAAQSANLGALDEPSRDLTQRVTLAVIGRAPDERQLAWARKRGWRHLKFFAAVVDDFARDGRGLTPEGDAMPALGVWVKQDGRVHPFGSSGLGGTEDPGQDARGAPDPTPLRNLLDLTPAGRGTDRTAKLRYDDAG